MQLTVGRNSILNFPAKIWTGMCKALLKEQWWLITVHSQSQSGKRLLLASRGYPIRSLAYQASCIDPTHQSQPLDLALKSSGAILLVTIWLINKDKLLSVISISSISTVDEFFQVYNFSYIIEESHLFAKAWGKFFDKEFGTKKWYVQILNHSFRYFNHKKKSYSSPLII